MVSAGTRRAEGPVRPAGRRFWLHRVGRVCLGAGLLAAISCATRGELAQGPVAGPELLPTREGATVKGRLRPGETALYSVSLEEGQYLELHLDRGPGELTGYLYGPGVEPTGGTNGACSWTELAPDVEGQVLWELAQASGGHRLILLPKGDEPVPYRLTITALRPGTPRDQARQRCDESFSEAESLRRKGSLEDAVERFGDTLELCRQGEYAGGVASTLSYRARALLALGLHKEARRDFEAAYEVWSKIGERYSMAGALVGLAGLERRLANWKRAEELLGQGLGLARESGFDDVEANGLDQYCRLYIDKGNTYLALEYCEKAVAMWKGLDDPNKQVASLNNLGHIYSYRGDLDAARAYYLRALAILETHPDLGRQATVRNNLALIYEAAGEYQKALAEYQGAAEAHLALERFIHAGVALQNIGEIQQRFGKVDVALDYLSEALVLMERAVNPLGRIEVLHSLGDLHQARGELINAERALEEALALSRRTEAQPYLAGSLVHIGKFHLTRGRPEEAVAALQEALELYRATEDRWQQTEVLTELAEAHHRLGDGERSLELLFEAADISEEIGDRTGTSESYYQIARIERGRGRLEAARSAVEQALGVVNAIRTVLGSNDLRSLFTATTRPYHELYVEILMAQHERWPDGGHDAEALRASEGARAQSLLEILAEADLGPGPEVPEELLAERATLLQLLNAKEIQRQRLLAEEEADPPALFRVELDLEGLLTDLREVERRVRAASPRYAALTYPQPVSVGEIQRTILDGDTALLEYSLGDERSFLWLVTVNGFRTYELPGRAEIDPVARCLHWLITAFGEPPDSLPSEDAACLGDFFHRYRDLPSGGHPLRTLAHRRRAIEAAFGEVAGRLSEVLLGGPARDGLLPFRLAVVSDGALEYVPFSLLPSPDGGGQLLVRSHEVVRQPSASVLAFQREQPAPATASSGELAIVADPVYSRDDERLVHAMPARNEGTRGGSDPERLDSPRRFTRLIYSKEEAERIARFAPSDRTFSALDAAASRETVLSGALSGYRYVHFATHGTIDTRFPELSSLVLSLVDDEGQERDDGYLRLNDIYGLELDATDMVVLSACETALGREVRGEGLVGLTRGFHYAGAERVVASLWQVQDRATARLMEHLYRGLLEEGRPPAEALRHAQLAILDEPGGSLAFPYYWAGFVLQGEWR